jgi:hypothetical protein
VFLHFQQGMRSAARRAWHGMASFLPTFLLLLLHLAGVAGSRNSPWAESDGGVAWYIIHSSGVLDLRSGCDIFFSRLSSISTYYPSKKWVGCLFLWALVFSLSSYLSRSLSLSPSLTYGVITEHTLGWLCAFLWCVLESSKMQNFLHKKRLQRSGRLITVFAKNARLFLHFQAQHSRKSPHHFESAYQQTRTVIFSLRGYFGRHWRSRIRSTNESSGIWKEGCRVGSTESRVFSAGQSLSSYENSGEVS